METIANQAQAIAAKTCSRDSVAQMASRLPLRPKGQAVRPKATMGPLKEMTAKHRLLIQYMVHGCDKPHLLSLTARLSPTEDDPTRTRPLRPGEPLRLEEAARILGFKLRHARHLMSQPIMIKAHASALDEIKNGAKVEALKKVVSLVSEPGDGSAAWAKVNLTAAQMIIGEPGDAKAAAVNVTVNNAIQLQPGIVIRLPANAPQSPLELQANNDDN